MFWLASRRVASRRTGAKAGCGAGATRRAAAICARARAPSRFEAEQSEAIARSRRPPRDFRRQRASQICACAAARLMKRTGRGARARRHRQVRRARARPEVGAKWAVRARARVCMRRMINCADCKCEKSKKSALLSSSAHEHVLAHLSSCSHRFGSESMRLAATMDKVGARPSGLCSDLRTDWTLERTLRPQLTRTDRPLDSESDSKSLSARARTASQRRAPLQSAAQRSDSMSSMAGAHVHLRALLLRAARYASASTRRKCVASAPPEWSFH